MSPPSNALPDNETDLISIAEGVAPSYPDLTERGLDAAGETGASDIASGILAELLPQYKGLLPATVIRDCVDQAVQDLIGSISAEALPEMASRLVAIRLEGDLPAADSSRMEGRCRFCGADSSMSPEAAGAATTEDGDT